MRIVLMMKKSYYHISNYEKIGERANEIRKKHNRKNGGVLK